ncbi:hypothetical protein M2163_003586 [Streptomyces sp. SAI-135]|uniref:hypothetical protein n=1 Tax=unclassified Streptomyces TaxID=2593676 RepID=UPI0024738EFD|nr:MULTISPECIES: hypothetical protein [unclassified Streptomyces]MDH6519430.1 hypothetical protein [Streptomyces sp. SAI-090]MDH6551653.1 hypothetical protein [Streptomyces sp. SAI-041]MDH6584290.1 hypothetical protein [Streptomyces sp. SAI-133]MDH6616478.1 hypothetical protein [Streptomyces sp. SAI-135]
MSADREKSHDMNDSDIALLLADAADEVEIGIAPYDAVLRGGRRRRARRWAVAAATALVLAGSSATLAVAGLPGGGGGGAVATRPTATGTPRVFEPANRITLAAGRENGKEWRVTLDSWQAPVDTAEARATLNAMRAHDEDPPDVREAADLVGRIAYFVHLDYGGVTRKVMENTVPKSDTLTGTDLMSGSLPLEAGDTKDVRLVIGYVAKTAQRVECGWTDGTKTVLERARSGTGPDIAAIRPAEGSPYDWFVCLAPKGTQYRTAEVVE